MEKHFVFFIVIFPVAICIVSLSQTGIENFEKSILNLKNDILKVADFQEFVDESVRFKTVVINTSSLLGHLSQLISLKFQKRVDAVNQLHNVVEASYTFNQWGHWMNCCLLDDISMKYNSNYKCTLYSFKLSFFIIS